MIRSSCYWQGIFRSVGEKRLLASSCPSVRPSVPKSLRQSVRLHVSAWLPLNGFPRNLVPRTSVKMCRKIRISLKSDKVDRGVFRIVGGVTCGATINRTPFCFSILTMVPRTRCFFIRTPRLSFCGFEILKFFRG